MARQSMVTRTLTRTTVEALCLDITSGLAVSKTLELSGVYKSEDSLMKKVKEKLETETLKVVHIANSSKSEQLYGMYEEEFMLLATPLEKR